MPDPPDPEDLSGTKLDSTGESTTEKFASLSLRDITDVTDAMRVGQPSAPIMHERPESRALPIPSPTANTDFAGEGRFVSQEAPRQQLNTAPELQQMALILEKIQERMTILERSQTRREALPTFKATSYVCGSETESEAMSEIDSVTNHTPSGRRDQPYCPYHLPALSVNGPSEIVDCKTSLIAYHDAITTPGWRDSKGTFEVLLAIQQANDVSNDLRLAIRNLTASTFTTPVMQKDTVLWQKFLSAFDAIHFVEPYRHISMLQRMMFSSPRKANEPPAIFLGRIVSSLGTYKQMSYPFPPNEASLAVVALTRLRFVSPLLSPIRTDIEQKFVAAFENGQSIGLQSLIDMVNSYPSLSQLIAAERRGVGTFMTEFGEEEKSGEEMYGAAAGVFMLPSVQSGQHEDEKKGPVLKQWGELPASSTSTKTNGYSVEGALKSFSVAEVSHVSNPALNKFPAKTLLGKKNLNKESFSQKSGAVRDELKSKLEVSCGRCFRPECSGPLGPMNIAPGKKFPGPKYFLNTACNQKGNPLYVADDLAFVIFSVLKWLRIADAKNADGSTKPAKVFYAQFVSTFYESGGTFENGPTGLPSSYGKAICDIVDSGKALSFASYTSSTQAYASLSRDNVLQRCLVAMPDLGNPSKLAGLCWWEDYLPELKRAGLADIIRKATSSDTAGFGDGPQKAPCFVALQVPVWYETTSGESMLVLENIRIVENEVGLLDSKANLSALGLSTKLSPDEGQSTFEIRGKPIKVVDSGHHFFLKLGKPKAIAPKTRAVSLQKDQDGILRAVDVCCGRSQIANGVIGHEKSLSFQQQSTPSSLTDETIEIKIENSFSSLLQEPAEEDTLSSATENEMENPVPWEWMLSERLPREEQFEGKPRSVEEHPLASFDDNTSGTESLVEIRPESSIEDSGASEFCQKMEASNIFVVNDNTESLTFETFTKLHDNLGHPSKSQMALLLKRGKYPEANWRPLLDAFRCSFCTSRSNGRVPSRPKSSYPKETGPGQSLHVDVGEFRHPVNGTFLAVLGADSFSDHAYGDAVVSGTGLEAARVILDIDEEYPEMTFDLAGWAKGADFVNFLSRMGTKVVYVPTEAHWKSRAENLVHRTRVELAAVFHEHPMLSNSSAIKVALKRINGRVLTKFGISRREIHKGRPPMENSFQELLLSAPYPLTPPWIQLEKRRAAAALNVQTFDRAKVRESIRRALKSRRSKAVNTCHGDEFLFWREGGKSKSSRGWQGPAVCIGVSGAVVIGWHAGQVITVHITRCVVTKRHSDGEKVFIPPSEIKVPAPAAKEDLITPRFDYDGNSEKDNDEDDEGDEDWNSVSSSEMLGSEELWVPTPRSPEKRSTLHNSEKEGTGSQADALTTPEVQGPVFSRADEDNGVEVLDFPLADTLEYCGNERSIDRLLGPQEQSDHEVVGQFPSFDVDAVLQPKPSHQKVLDGDVTRSAEESGDMHALPSFAPDGIADNPVPFRTTSVEDAQSEQQELRDLQFADESRENEDTEALLRETAVDRQNFTEIESQRLALKKRKEDMLRETAVERQNITEIESQRLALKKRLREISDASRNGREYPKEDESDSVPQEQKDYFKRRRCHALKGKARWYDDEREFNRVFACAYDVKLPLELTTSTCYYYQPTKLGPVVRRCYLANKAKQRTLVLDFEEASKDPLMKQAMENEIKSFESNKCVEEVSLSLLEDHANKVSTRWVLTLKTNEDGTRKCKARLVARGFEDLEKDIITRDSPVASTASQRLVVQACVESQFHIHSWDFKTAFLQGKLMSRDNPVYIMPPKGFGVREGKVWKLLRPVYGLSSAPKAWYDRLLEVMENCGFDSKLTDEGVLRMIGRDGNVAGVLALHVDDTIGGGTSEFHRAMDLVCQSLEVGAKEKDCFHYKGLRVTTVWENEKMNSDFHITLDGDEYLDSLMLMDVPIGDDCQKLSPSEASDFRSVAGCVGYIANAFRPELAYECSMLGREFFSPTIGSAKIANDTIAWAKDNRYNLTFKKGCCDSLTVFCDSAGPTEDGTQGGRLVALTDALGNSVSSFLFWESRKVKRVCKATITGETLSAGEGHESAMWIQQMWFELTGKRIPIRIVVDSEGLLKNSGTTKLPLQKRLRIDMAALRQGLRRGEFVMTWVPSKANISDQMTKSQPRGSKLTKPNDDMKKPLVAALRTNITGLSRFKQVTKTQADVSNY